MAAATFETNAARATAAAAAAAGAVYSRDATTVNLYPR